MASTYRTRRAHLALTAGAVLLTGLGPIAQAPSGAATGQPVEVAVAGRANANASVAAQGRLAVLVWGASTPDGVTDVYAAISRDAGRSFGAPVRVNQPSRPASLSGEQPPRVALVSRPGRDPSVVVVWTAKSPAGTRLFSARSDDGGRSFAPPTIVPGGDAPGNRGWESIAAGSGGSVAALWLDHRELASGQTATPMTHGEHQHGASTEARDGAGRAQLSQLFFGRLGSAASAHSVSRGVCYCCKTALATGPTGEVYAAWRHVYPGNVRDIAFTMSTDGGQTFAPPVRVSEDNWVLDGCPENGPTLSVDKEHRIHVVWPTLVPGPTPASEAVPALFYAMSRDGRRFTARQRIPTAGVPRHPQMILTAANQIAVTWDEQVDGGGRRVVVARADVDDRGVAQFTRQRTTSDPAGTYPAIASADGGTIVAWTGGPAGQTRVRVERLP